MMKKLFFKFSMLLLVLGLSTNVAWADEEEVEQKIYFASLKAQTAPESTGSGQVKLTWLDITGEPMTVKMAKDLNCAAFGTDPADQTTYDLSHWKESNGPANTAQMIGGTLLAMDGIELPGQMGDQIYTTSYLYFHAEGFPADGSYLAGWTFTDPKITRMTSSMNPGDPMGNGSDIPYRTPCFKVLPDTANSAIFPTGEVEEPTEPQQGDYDSQEEYQQAMAAYGQDMQAYIAYATKQVAMIAKAQDVVQNKYNNLYAVFAKYLLSNPNATGALVATTEGATAELQLTFDVEGDVTQFKNNYADFQFPSYPHSVCVAMSLAEEPFAQDEYGAWTWDFAETPVEFLSATKARAHIKIIYTAKAGIMAGEHTTTLTVAMKGTNPSTLNIPLTVMARPASSNAASVKVGETTTEYEKLADAVTAANAASGDITLTLLRDVAVSSTITLFNTMTLDLNGYKLSAASAADKGMADKAVLTIDASGKTVTLAYNKLGGAIEAAPKVKNFAIINGVGVEVKAGTLVLNGGTISADNQLTAYQWNESVAPSDYWTLIPYEFASIQSVAVKVASGATLIQNGATITATSNGPNAYGIVNNGTVTINQGTISAEAQYNGAMAVNAMSGSTTTVNGGSLSALVHEVSGTVTFNPAVPAGLSTWSNVYGVYVGAGSTVTLNGGELYAESTGTDRAFGVGALANFGGTLTINKGATMRAKSPNDTESFPLAIMAAGSYDGAVTINGGKFDGWFKSPQTGNDTINPAVFGLDYTDVTFKSGICKTDKFFMKHPRFASSAYYPANTLFNVVKGGKDYVDGYRYIAVADPATQNDRIAAGVPACRIGTVGYTKLEDALAYANNNPNEELVIFMMNDYTLPAGYYTLPAKATLVVPMSDEQAKEVNVTVPRHVFNDATDEETTHYIEPTEFRRLTFANGVNMEVFGDIELSCTQFASNEAYTGQPYGPYGHLVMEEGSKMTLQSGSELRAWGYMTGAGETDARRGSTVREMFQLGDWKGAFTSVKIVGMAAGDEDLLNMVGDDSDKKIFPVTQYFIQNVESPVKYHPGALLTTTATVSEGLTRTISISMAATDIQIVGVSGTHQAIFLMDIAADADNTWVRKWYDAEHDIQVYDVNSAAHIGSMVLDMGEMNLMGFKVPVKLNSAKFDLPITCNMKIHLFSGSLDFKQNTCLLPGAEVQVDKESTVSVAMSASEQQTYNQWKAEHAAWVKGGQEGDEPQKPVLFTGALYVYDKDDWGQYAYRYEVDEEYDEENPQAAYTKTVRYTPSANNGEGGRPAVRNEMICPEDAAINVRGTFTTATGFVYTSQHGANIFSNNADAGTFIFNEDAANADNPREVNQVKVTGSGILGRNTSYETINFYPARLKHGDETYENTDVAKEGDAYCYKDNLWFIMRVDPDNACFMVDNRGTYYAKPQDYVAVVAKKQLKRDEDDELVVDNDGNPRYEIVGNADHTYSDKAGTGRLFILMEDNCQWWEVEKEDNLYHCIHPENDTYYYWDEDEEMWLEQKFTITWRNWNGEIVQTADKDGRLQDSYEVKYGTQAEFIGTNPTREQDIDYTYDFTGWSPTPGRVTNNVTYTATFEAKDRMYTIKFLAEGGSEIERQFLKHNDVPVCENTPTKIGHTLVWSPAISPVIGDQTYTATWLENPPTEWDVTFVNNAGGELQATAAVSVNAHPVYSGSTPAKENADHTAYTSNEYTYIFWGWSAVIDGVAQQFAADAELPSPTAPTTYTAVYTEVAKTYKVRFYQADGTTQIGEDQNLAYGAMPVVPASNLVTEPGEEGYTYTYVWQNKADDSKTVETVKAAADYKAVFTGTKNKYKVTLSCATPGGCTFAGAGIYEHGTNVTIAAIPNRGYEFVKWQERAGDADLGSQTITADITLTAVVNEVVIPEPTNLTVGIDATETIASATDYANLTITSDGLDQSSQIVNADNIDLLGNADFIYKREFQAGMWYCVAVPWRVEANGGVFLGHSGTPAVLGKDYEICYYDGEVRAAQGKVDACWVYMKNVNKKILEPGRAYMFYIKHGVLDQVVFRKKAYESILTEVTAVKEYPYTTGDSKDGGWNGIANPALYHAYINAGSADAKAQRYLPDEERYDWFVLSAHPLVVGEPIYVQATSPKTIIANSSSYSSAPARRANAYELAPKYDVCVTAAGATKYADHLSVSLNEDKEENNYVIGQDLTKFGVSSKVAQMWINRYDAKLCVNAVVPEGEVTSFPMSIFAPKAGTYTIAIERELATEDYALYLTYNGEAIWNLSDGAYTANLNKGTDANYGLRISIKAPQVHTGVDEAIVEAQGDTKKVLINNQVFIIRGDKVYSIDGQLIK